MFLDRGRRSRKEANLNYLPSVRPRAGFSKKEKKQQFCRGFSWSGPRSICEEGGSGACGAVTPFILVNRILLNRGKGGREELGGGAELCILIPTLPHFFSL